ncbi:MAG: DUF6268 family outer membrane beta-barrel protein [Cytophagales bacterium]|nr:DUF6268 family outer membrane beta-barrel protein [Cytophagales bacterium]
MRLLIVIFILCATANLCFCQKEDAPEHSSSERQKKPFNVRPTFFYFSVRTLPAINSFSGDGQIRHSDFDINKSYKIKLNVPVITANKLKVIGQLRYNNEQLHLGEDFLENEQEIHFDNAGMSLMLKYDLKNSYFLGGHVSGFFKADKLTFAQYASILDYSGSIVFGKETEYGSIGFGALMGNSLGRFRLYPMILMDHQLSDSWKLEMKLPKEVQLRKMLKPDNFYFTGGAEVNAASYFISNDIYQGVDHLEYRRAAVDFRIGIEKEIHDFLWFGVDLGFTQPVYSALVESGEPTRNKLFDFDQSFTPYTSISVFIVPPRSLFSRFQ